MRIIAHVRSRGWRVSNIWHRQRHHRESAKSCAHRHVNRRGGGMASAAAAKMAA